MQNMSKLIGFPIARTAFASMQCVRVMECLGCKATPLLFGDSEHCGLVYQLAGVEL